MKGVLLCLPAAVLIVGCFGGGEEELGDAGDPAPAPDAGVPAGGDLKRCQDDRDPAVTAFGWSGSVSGISCREAGRLILRHFARDFDARAPSRADSIRRSNPAAFESEGFRCDSYPLESGFGWHLTCGRPGQAMSFFFTP